MIWPWACQCIAWAAVKGHVPNVRANSCGWAAHVGFQHGAILVLGAGKKSGRTSQQPLEIQKHSLLAHCIWRLLLGADGMRRAQWRLLWQLQTPPPGIEPGSSA